MTSFGKEEAIESSRNIHELSVIYAIFYLKKLEAIIVALFYFLLHLFQAPPLYTSALVLDLVDESGFLSLSLACW